MAKSKSLVLSNNSFAESLFSIGTRFSLAKVFDDFLTMTIAACSINPLTKLSNYEEEYLQTIAPYKESELRHEFPKAFAHLIRQMEERVTDSQGNDILGEFFEQHLSNGRNGQFFTPFHICELIASVILGENESKTDTPIRILDPTCGSGRMLLAARKSNATAEYYGIDIDHTCVKMAALNLFLNGMWNSEVLCADSLRANDFVISYHISLLPFGIFKITDKEKSKLWHMHQKSFEPPEKKKSGELIELDKTPFKDRIDIKGTQLDLF